MAEKKSILTVNLGSQRVGMARFSLAGKGALLLREYAFEELPADIPSEAARKSLVTNAIKSLAGKLKAAGSEANYAVAANNTITRFVKLPSLGEDQVDRIVGFEAQQAVPFPLNETVWDYQVMGKEGGEVEVAIVAIRADQLEESNQQIAGGGLSTKLVDAAPLALYNAFRYNYGEQEGCTLIIDLGAKSTNLIFLEGQKLFISSFQNAGLQISQAIAKELEGDVGTAEERKKEVGFVHLGGNYADHDDPEVDAISKVIRNQLTRLHGDVNRRIQQAKQSGFSTPANVYLAGGGANLPYLKEFFEEKLRLPVHWFNSLANVSVGPKVDVERAGREAHMLGELIGLALREMSCPMELDLSPKSVESARDVAAKKPMLLTAAACLVAALGGQFAYNKIATGAAEKQLASVTKDYDALNAIAQQASGEEKKIRSDEARVNYLREAVGGRTYWLNMLNEINKQFTAGDTDGVWLTQICPLDAEGQQLAGKITSNSLELDPSISPASSGKGGPASKPTPNPDGTITATIDSLHIAGLYKKDQLTTLISKLGALGDYFDLPENWTESQAEWFKANRSEESTNEATSWQLRIPLKNKQKITVPAQRK